MGQFNGFKCSLCGHEYSPTEVEYTCPDDNGNLDVILDFQHVLQALGANGERLGDEPSLWRYLPLLPVNDPGWSRHPTPCGWLDTRLCSATAES